VNMICCYTLQLLPGVTLICYKSGVKTHTQHFKVYALLHTSAASLPASPVAPEWVSTSDDLTSLPAGCLLCMSKDLLQLVLAEGVCIHERCVARHKAQV
jgi:hypothetical protein